MPESVTTLPDKFDLPLRQRGFMAADELDKLAARTSLDVDRELFICIARAIRELAYAVPPSDPVLVIVK